MNNFYKKVLSKHISTNRFIYILAVLAVLAGLVWGITSGAKSAKVDNPDYINNFFSSYMIGGSSSLEIFVSFLLSNLRTIAVIWVAGWFVWLTPLCFAELGAKSFGIGFSFAYLILNGGFKGLMLSIISLLMQSLISLPLLIIYTVIQIGFAGEFDRVKKTPSAYNEKKQLMIKNLLSLVMVILPTLVCGLLDAYITPLLVKFLL